MSNERMNKSKIQKIFDMAIERGRYKEGSYMNIAVDRLCNAELITEKEYRHAIREINKCLRALRLHPGDAIILAFVYASKDYGPVVDGMLSKIIMKMYKDWRHRPKNTEELKKFIIDSAIELQEQITTTE